MGPGVFLSFLIAMVSVTMRVGTGQIFVVLITIVTGYPGAHVVDGLYVNPESAGVVRPVRAGFAIIMFTPLAKQFVYEISFPWTCFFQ